MKKIAETRIKKVTKMAELQEILNGKRPGDKMSKIGRAHV